MYVSAVPYGTISLQDDEILEKARVPKAKGSSISETTEARLLHPEKEEFPTYVIPLGIVIEVKFEQPRKVLFSILLIPIGIVRVFRLIQPLNALFPIDVML